MPAVFRASFSFSIRPIWNCVGSQHKHHLVCLLRQRQVVGSCAGDCRIDRHHDQVGQWIARTVVALRGILHRLRRRPNLGSILGHHSVIKLYCDRCGDKGVLGIPTFDGHVKHRIGAKQLGKSIPMQDKLRVLADWLHVSADELRFGTLTPTVKVQGGGFDTTALTMQDRDMLVKYTGLSVVDRKTVCDVVQALAVAASVKVRG